MVGLLGGVHLGRVDGGVRLDGVFRVLVLVAPAAAPPPASVRGTPCAGGHPPREGDAVSDAGDCRI